jgi:hypothetical protein
LDISIGGASLSVPKVESDKIGFKKGDILNVVFNIKERWKLELPGEIRHLSAQEDSVNMGYQFDLSDTKNMNRMNIMMMSLLKGVIF